MAVQILLTPGVTIDDFKAIIGPLGRTNINIQNDPVTGSVFDDTLAEKEWEYIMGHTCPYREVTGECALYECYHTCETLAEGTEAYCPPPDPTGELCQVGCNCEPNMGYVRYGAKIQL